MSGPIQLGYAMQLVTVVALTRRLLLGRSVHQCSNPHVQETAKHVISIGGVLRGDPLRENTSRSRMLLSVSQCLHNSSLPRAAADCGRGLSTSAAAASHWWKAVEQVLEVKPADGRTQKHQCKEHKSAVAMPAACRTHPDQWSSNAAALPTSRMSCVDNAAAGCQLLPLCAAAVADVLYNSSACLLLLLLLPTNNHDTQAPRDPILGVTEAFLADRNPDKINLGVVSQAGSASGQGSSRQQQAEGHRLPHASQCTAAAAAWRSWPAAAAAAVASQRLCALC